MKFDKFTNGNHFTIGIELELRILDAITLVPQNEFEFLVAQVEKEFQPHLAQEFLASMIEINSPIFHHTNELIHYLQRVIKSLKCSASKKNLYIQASGTLAQEHQNIKINSNVMINFYIPLLWENDS